MRRIAVLAVLLFATPAMAQRNRADGPATQARFTAVVDDFAGRYAAARDASTRRETVQGRGEVLCPTLPPGMLRGWTGTVERVLTEGDRVGLAVRVGDRAVFTSAVPASHPSIRVTMAPAGSPVARAREAYRIGQRVEFNGIFIGGPAPVRCAWVLSETEAGAMEAPRFAFSFEEVRAVR